MGEGVHALGVVGGVQEMSVKCCRVEFRCFVKDVGVRFLYEDRIVSTNRELSKAER